MDFTTGSLATLNLLWKLYLEAVTHSSNLWNSSTRIIRCSIECTFTPVIYLFTFQWSNGSFLAYITTATDSCKHLSAAFMPVWCRYFTCVFFFFPVWHLHTFCIVLSPVTRVRNRIFNVALSFRTHIGIGITPPSIDDFCNHIFKLQYKNLAAFTFIHRLWYFSIYLCFHVI